MQIATHAKLKEKGQITIPSRVRSLMNLHPDEEMILLATEKEIILKPKIENPLDKAGMLGKETEINTVKELIFKYEHKK